MLNSKKVILWLSLLPLLLSLGLTIFILLSTKILPPKLPLFYSLPWGDKQLASQQQLLIIPSSIILIALFNLVISWQLHLNLSFFKKILLLASLLISLILTITLIKIVLIFI